jgi:D-3-phosphoglycerate dehydrogenase / 2-oxoglutarate reductase
MADNTGQKTVVITDYDYDDVDVERAIIEQAGLRLATAQCKTEDDVISVARDADAIIAQYATVGAKAISALTRCEVIARYGTGTDIIDIDAATRHGILVTNVPNDWCENEVADHAMALLLGAARKICKYDQATRAGIWRWQTGEPIHRLSGRTLGLLSFGAIAQAIGRRAAGFGLRVIASDPYMPAADIADRGAVPVSLEKLLDQADYLVIQAPLTKETHHLIGEPELRRMKPTAILINTARGPIVNDQALYQALTKGWIACAGLDDIEEEPAKHRDWTPANPLFGLDNVIITPHAAYYSEEAIHTVRDFAASEVVRVLGGQPPLSPVNAPQVASTRRAAGSRLATVILHTRQQAVHRGSRALVRVHFPVRAAQQLLDPPPRREPALWPIGLADQAQGGGHLK